MQVLVLVEQPLTAGDAEQITARYRGRTDETGGVRYHVVIPAVDATARLDAAVGTLAGTEVLATSPLYFADTDLEELRREVEEASRQALQRCVDALRATGATAGGEVTREDPLDRVAALAAEGRADEVLVVTRPHVVADLLHVDWTSRARRRLSVPCVHLLAQQP